MNKQDLIKDIAERGEFTKADADAALKAVQGAIAAALTRGDKITLPGFGTFKVVETAARTGRNPQTGEPVEIPAKRKIKFNPTQALKDLVQ
ncbi:MULTISPECIES: HU family DNA-binding protein [Eikenella]|uniref:HU family DNA-binding protein n=1 Tax=Eikenella glucosivorans TaxID=2766967 RepID=A0ABS0N9M4_9NEIS|nr:MULTISPECIES: HU family DNA-binding protein [Eikenella]MBH5328999.1 HU family DNA-binding protein [Eikenella glucosivorans]